MSRARTCSTLRQAEPVLAQDSLHQLEPRHPSLETFFISFGDDWFGDLGCGNLNNCLLLLVGFLRTNMLQELTGYAHTVVKLLLPMSYT